MFKKKEKKSSSFCLKRATKFQKSKRQTDKLTKTIKQTCGEFGLTTIHNS